MELQNRLISEGYLKAEATGYFGPLTFAAVKAYQTANGLPSTGFVGPLTLAKLNADADVKLAPVSSASMKTFIETLISTGMISGDKAAAARAWVK